MAKIPVQPDRAKKRAVANGQATPTANGSTPTANGSAYGPLPKVEPIDAIYYRKSYFIPADDGGYREVDKSFLTSMLQREMEAGAVESFLHNVFRARSVDLVGPLSGHPTGLYQVAPDQRVFVTSSPILITPKAGQWPLLREVFKVLLDDTDKKNVIDQRKYFYGWLRYALRVLYAGPSSKGFDPGQALALAGVIGSAKTLIILLVIQMLGGRAAHPALAMVNGTTFNEDWFRGEVLMIDDEKVDTSERARRSFGAQLKKIVAPGPKQCHGKNKTPIEAQPFWRLVIACNEEPENLMVLPSLDGDIKDKVMLLRTKSYPMPMPTEDETDKATFWAALCAELPAFVHWLLNDWQMPPEVVNKVRFGVKEFQHPVLKEKLDKLSREAIVWEAIQRLFTANSHEWTGTATELTNQLYDQNAGGFLRNIIYSPNATGTYLGLLQKKYPELISSKRTKHGSLTVWTIKEPA